MEKTLFSDSLFSYRSAVSVSLSYALFSAAWILFSDQILFLLILDPELLTKIQTFKGWTFVILSAFFIYTLLYRKIEKLRHAEKSYLEIFNTTTEALFVHDVDSGKIIDINSAAVNMFGYSVQEARQFTVSDFKLERHATDTEYSHHPTKEMTKHFIRQLHKKNDAIFWTEISSQQFQSKDKSLTITTVRDITSQKGSEDVLRALAETATVANDDIFQVIARQMALSLNMRIVLIGIIDPLDRRNIDTIAIWNTDHFMDNIRYSLMDTPCENVTSTGMCIYRDDVARLFPKDKMLAELGLKSYVGVPLKNNKGEVLGLIALLDDKPMDIKSHTMDLLNSLAVRASIELECKKTNEKLKLSSRVFTDTHEGIMITDTIGIIVDVNPMFCEVTGYSREEIIGQTPSLLNSGKNTPQLYIDMWQEIDANGHWQGEISNRKKNGELYIELLNISSLKNEVGDIINYVGIFTDITQSKAQQYQLEIMAHYDLLTQLPNRILFADRFKQACAQSRRFDTSVAVCFLDLDRFKPVNDNYGHTVGDGLLVEVAKRIKANIRDEDTVSRQGGDEFAILLVNLESPFQGQQMLERIQHAVAQPFSIDGHSISISASMGVTLYPSDDADLDTLLRHADQAMYKAKLNGRNNYQFFNLEDDRQTLNKHLRLQEINEALHSNQFRLYYQPKVNMRTGEVLGAEALIRWEHPERGLIPPLDFLPIIEGHELENKIGKWVIEQAVKQMDEWLSQNITLQVSVNIASQHLQTAAFCNELDTALANNPNVNAQYLQLEILESSVLGDLNEISSILKKCRNNFGVSFALDDFGTGYSSLTHLRNLPVNTVKIDQSFVKNMLVDPNDYAIIDGVIGLTESFGLEVIAEGVETAEMGALLLIMGCDLAQGYEISRPMPADNFTQWINDYTPNPIWSSYADNNLNEKQKHVNLCRLTIQQWKNQFERNIFSNTTRSEGWPILDSSKCHCSSWIKRERQGNVIDKLLLDKFDEVHEQLHAVAYEIYIAFEKNNQDATGLNFSELEKVFNLANAVLDLCEQ